MYFRLLLIMSAGLALPVLSLAQVSVRVVPLEDALVDLERRAPAEVMSLNDAVVAAEVAAVVRAVHADVGEVVSAGDLLLELDDGDYRLILRQAEAELVSSRAQKAQADAKLSRARDLTENDYLSADTLLDRETDVAVWAARIQANEVALAVAKRNLGKCLVTAAFDGVVAERQAQIGGFVINGSPLLRLIQLDQSELDAELPASIAASIATASDIYFLSRSQRWPVKLLRLSPAIESERRSIRARFAFTAEAPTVGRSGEVVWSVGSGMLPSNLVSRRNGRLGVFLHHGGKAVFTPLPGAQEGRPAAVDLPLQSEVIVYGRDRVQNGDPVTVSR
jgi:RND family efflux transporter MFP subunit